MVPRAPLEVKVHARHTLEILMGSSVRHSVTSAPGKKNLTVARRVQKSVRSLSFSRHSMQPRTRRRLCTDTGWLVLKWVPIQQQLPVFGEGCRAAGWL